MLTENAGVNYAYTFVCDNGTMTQDVWQGTNCNSSLDTVARVVSKEDMCEDAERPDEGKKAMTDCEPTLLAYDTDDMETTADSVDDDSSAFRVCCVFAVLFGWIGVGIGS